MFKDINEDFNDFKYSEEDINQYLKKIYYGQFKYEDIIRLTQQIKKYQNSVYVGHLDLIIWCKKALIDKWDDYFQKEFKTFFIFYDLLTDNEEYFLLLCQKLYLIRQKRFNEFSDLDDKLSQMTNHFCEGLYHYVHMSYLFNTENYHDLFKEIQLTKEITTKEHNKRQYYSASQYEAIYYSHIGDQKKEISLYEKMVEYYLEEKDSTNCGVIMHNIANMYLLQKKFKKAIPYYEKAITHYAISNSYFELAWCYYIIG